MDPDGEEPPPTDMLHATTPQNHPGSMTLACSPPGSLDEAILELVTIRRPSSSAALVPPRFTSLARHLDNHAPNLTAHAGMDRVDVNVDALKSEIRRALINRKKHPPLRISVTNQAPLFSIMLCAIYLIIGQSSCPASDSATSSSPPAPFIRATRPVSHHCHHPSTPFPIFSCAAQ